MPTRDLPEHRTHGHRPSHPGAVPENIGTNLSRRTPRISRSADPTIGLGLRRILGPLVLVGLLVLCPVPSSGACDSFGDHLRWVAGTSPYTYLQGGPEQGTFDLDRSGNWLLVPDVYFGLSCYEIVAPGEVELRGQMETSARRVASEGSFVYVGEDARLVVAEVTSTGDLLPRGTLGGIDLSDLAVEGDYVYTAGWTGLDVLSVADPDAPSLVGSLPGDCVRIAVRGDRAYVSRITGLWVVDISDPADPQFLGEAFTAPNLYDIVIDGDRMYVGQTSYGLRVFDLTDPDAPALLAGAPFTGAAGVVVGEGHALAGSEATFLHVDVSDPGSPLPGGMSRSAGIAGGTILDGFAYLGSYRHGLQVVELGDGGSPTPVFSLPSAAFGSHLTRLGDDLAFIDSQGLQILDVGAPATPTLLGSLPLALPESMCAAGDYVYVVANGLYVVDASDRSAPSVVGFLPEVNGQLSGTANGRVYVSAVSNLSIIDVSVPTQPVLLFVDTNFFLGVGALAVDGYDVYVGANYESAGFVDKYDYTVPQSRVMTASTVTDWVSELLVRDGTLYCAGEFEVSAWDEDLSFLGSVGEHEFAGGFGQRLIASGPDGRLLVSNPWGGFHLFEGMGTLTYIGSGATSVAGAYGLADLGSHLYVTDGTGLHVYEAPCSVSGIGSDGIADGDPTDGGGRGESFGRGALRAEPNPSPGPIRLSWAQPGGRTATIGIFDSRGRRVRILRESGSPDGIGACEWDARDDSGVLVPSGVYWARFRGASGEATRSVRIVR